MIPKCKKPSLALLALLAVFASSSRSEAANWTVKVRNMPAGPAVTTSTVSAVAKDSNGNVVGTGTYAPTSSQVTFTVTPSPNPVTLTVTRTDATFSPTCVKTVTATGNSNTDTTFFLLISCP
jgi:hypothetical protein